VKAFAAPFLIHATFCLCELQYLKLYVGLEPPIAFEKVNPRWEVGVGMSDGQFQQVGPFFHRSYCLDSF
jgi:hypothetical protein